jgi:methionine transaminase
MQIQSKLPQVGTTIFTTMSSLANKHNAINLGQGFPDFSMPSALMSFVNQAIAQGQNQYTHMYGYPPLTNLLAQKYNSLYNCNINAADNITITPGGTYAIYTALTTLLQPNNEVIVFEPAYDCYVPTIQLLGAKPVAIALEHPTYAINWEQVNQRINANTRLIIINNPHNPTGAVLTQNDIAALQKIVAAHPNICILSDEVYEHLIFDNKTHHSVLKYPDLAEKSFVVFSFGKTYHCTGWKLGYCIAPTTAMAEFRKIHQFNAFTCNTPLQVGIANYLTSSNDYLELGNFMESKRNYFETQMQQTKFIPLTTNSTYFQLYDYSHISNLNEYDFAVWLTENHGVTTIPVSAFYTKPINNNVVRFCFAKNNNVIDAAISKLIKL